MAFVEAALAAGRAGIVCWVMLIMTRSGFCCWQKFMIAVSAAFFGVYGTGFFAQPLKKMKIINAPSHRLTYLMMLPLWQYCYSQYNLLLRTLEKSFMKSSLESKGCSHQFSEETVWRKRERQPINITLLILLVFIIQILPPLSFEKSAPVSTISPSLRKICY